MDHEGEKVPIPVYKPRPHWYIEREQRCHQIWMREEVGKMDVKFPIGPLQVPEHATTEDVKKWLEQIGSYAARLREEVDELEDEQLEKTYREGSWTIRQLVHHIADSQLTMYQRLKLALTENNPTVPAFDEQKWVAMPDSDLPLESSLRILEGLNERIVTIGSSLDSKQLERVFTHEVNGEISVATKLAKLSWHEEHHLAHIQIALEN